MVKVFVIFITFIILVLFFIFEFFLATSLVHFVLVLYLAECLFLKQLLEELHDVINLIDDSPRSKLFSEFSDALKSFLNYFLVLLILEYFEVVRVSDLIKVL